MIIGTVASCRHCKSRIYDNPLLEWKHVDQDGDLDCDAQPAITPNVRDFILRYEDNLTTLASESSRTEDEYDYHRYDKASEDYDTLCHNSGICYALGCFTATSWCAYCDTHCVHEDPEHRNHDDDDN